MPKCKTIPLTKLNLYEEISKKDLRIKNIVDDLNITSNNGRKILYRFKENKIFGDKKILLPAISTNNLIENNKKIKEENKLINNRINRLVEFKLNKIIEINM
jgi:hypothetical protein